jgi:serine/threonine protein kinase
MSKKGAVVNGCMLFHYLFLFAVDEMGELLGEGSFGKVRKAIHLNTKKAYAIKTLDLEVEKKRKIADTERVNLERLKGFSPYLVNLVDCFDDVCCY